MALAPFFSRVNDAIRSVVDIPYEHLHQLLEQTVVSVTFGDDDSPAFVAGAQLLANLLARLYPQLEFDGSEDVVATCTALAQRVNPNIDLSPAPGRRLRVGFGTPSEEETAVSVTASGWTVYVDSEPATASSTVVFSHLAAACFAAAEVFRVAFYEVLGDRRRTGKQPGVFDLITGEATPSIGPSDLVSVELPPLHIAGMGAIGQAAVLALQATGADGTVILVDPENVELSNLQRYVLSTMGDVGTSKVELAASVLRLAGWRATAVPTIWGADERSGPRQDTVLVALDSARDRLGVAAGLHGHVYNAWTQPADLGWSRHENFRIDPCLACLYYPDHVGPSEDEQVAVALRQHRLRILSYFVTNQPVGLPLRAVSSVADMPAPPDSPEWLAVPLLADLVAAGIVSPEVAPEWAVRTIGELYVEGICGGGLVRFGFGDLSREVSVPLAHQSALAGIMLVVQPFVAAIPQLRSLRPTAVECRLDLLAGLPQMVVRPRTRTPGCLCSDPAYG